MPTAEAGGEISVPCAHIRRPRDLRVCTHLDQRPPVMRGLETAVLHPVCRFHAPRIGGQLLAHFADADDLRPGKGQKSLRLSEMGPSKIVRHPHPLSSPLTRSTIILYLDMLRAVAWHQHAHVHPALRPVPPMYTNRAQCRTVVISSLQSRSNGADLVRPRQ